MKRMRLFSISATALLVSCSVPSKPAADVKRVTFRYEALASMEPRDIPTYVYVFPPLKSAKGGRPIENLTPVISDAGEVTEWKTTSQQSMRLKSKIENQLAQGGYEVVSFADLLSVRKPYSVLVVSTFYTLSYDVKDEDGQVTDKANLVLIKGSLFDGSLDPKSKKDIIKVDGVTKIPTGKSFPDTINLTVEQAVSWFADNSTGFVFLDSDF